MCKAYLNVIAEQVPKAVNVLDRFHVMKNMNTAIDEVRRAEAAELKRDGKEQILKHSRWCLLKRPENLTGQQAAKLDELVKYNLKGSSGIFVARGGRFGDFDGVECRDGNTLCALCSIARDR